MTQQTNPSTQTGAKEATPARERLPKGYKLPKSMKGSWFLSMGHAAQRAFMLAHQAGETRAKNATKRDIEQYAESPANRNIGRNPVML